MTTAVQRRRGTTTEHASFTGLEGEISVNTTKETLVVHDGSTAGGFELARADGSNFVATSVDINGGTIDGTTIGASSASTGAFTTLTASGEITANGGIALGDNDKATFGAGDDLQIYHDGSSSFIKDAGTGNLIIQATDLQIANADNTANYIRAFNGGAVDLRYAGAAKLATTSTGIDVTGNVESDSVTIGVGAVAGTEKLRVNGTVLTLGGTAAAPAIGVGDVNTGIYAPTVGTLGWTVNGTQRLLLNSSGIDVTGSVVADGLTVVGSATSTFNSGSENLVATFTSTDTEAQINLVDTTGSAQIRSRNDLRFYVNGGSNRAMDIASNGDISFYEDTGTTPKLFWDASAETLTVGAGASSTATISAYSRTVSAGLPSALRIVENTSASSYWDIGSTGGASNNLNFYANAVTTPKMTLTGSGNVGIGNTSPYSPLSVTTTGTLPQDKYWYEQVNMLTLNGTRPRAGLSTAATAGGNAYDGDMLFYNMYYDGGADYQWKERMRITSNGNVGIGTSSPSAALHVSASPEVVTKLSCSAGSNALLLISDPTTTTAPYIGSFGNVMAFGRYGGGESMRIDSAGNVGIGATSASGSRLRLDNGGTSGAPQLMLTATGAGTQTEIRHDTSGNLIFDYWNGGGTRSERMRIDASGNITVTTSGTAMKAPLLQATNGNVAAYGGTTPTLHSPASATLAFSMGGSERMRIDSSGRVGIGVTPAKLLHIESSTTSPALLVKASGQTGNTTTTAELILANGSLSSNDSAPKVIAYRTADYSSAALRSSGLKFQTTNANAPVTAMTINNTGNVGIGTDSPSEKLHIQGDGADILLTDAAGGQTAKLGATGSNNGLLELNNSAHVGTVFLNSSGDSYLNGGNVGIGTGSPTNVAGYTTTNIGAGTVGSILKMDGATSGFYHRLINNNGDLGIQADQGNAKPSTNITFSVDGSERARIDSSGRVLIGISGASGFATLESNDLAITGQTILARASGSVLVGTTSNAIYSEKFNITTGSDTQTIMNLVATGTSAFGAIKFRNGSGEIGSISFLSAGVAYNTTSDQRLKENIADADDAGSKIDAIQVRQYDWKADGSHQDYGMVAQELLEVAPEAVSQGETEEEMMGVDYSKLVPMLIKEIQSLRNRVAQLEG